MEQQQQMKMIKDVTYTIEVTNQGTVDAQNIDLIDYIPNGMTLSAADPLWTAAGATATTTLAGPLAAGASTTVDIILTVDPTITAQTDLVNYAEITEAEDLNGTVQDDVDSTPDTTVGNDAGGTPQGADDDFIDGDGTGNPLDGMAPTDEDDQDPALITVEVFDLALIKTTTQTSVMAGDDVTFTITVFNQGTIDAQNIDVIDYIPTGFTLSANDTNGWVPAGANATNTIAGPIAAGASSTIDIILTVDPAAAVGSDLENLAEITAAEDTAGMSQDDVDSTPDSTPGNDGTPIDDATMDPADEDDHDPAVVTVVLTPVFDLALTKVPASAGPFVPGDDVTFTITVINQGNVAASAIELIDYIPAGMTLSLADPLWTAAGANATTTIAGPLAAGAMTTVDIILTIDPTAMAGDLVNYAEITAANDDVAGGPGMDADSTPDTTPGNDAGGNPETPSDDTAGGDGTGAPLDTDPATDEDDQDPALISVDIFDLALIKQVSSTQTTPIYPGDDVTFTITVENQGTLDAQNVDLVDYIPNGFTLSAADPIWTAAGANATTTLAGPIAAGASTMVNIILTVDPTLTSAADLVNSAEITGAEDLGGMMQDDIDSTPDATAGNDAGGLEETASDDVLTGDGTGAPDDAVAATDEDDEDPALIPVEIFDLALVKTTAATSVFPGDDVTYTIEVINQGTVDAENILISDYIPAGFILSAADANGWAGPSTGPVTTTIAGPIAAGASTTVDIILTAGAATGTAVNVAEVSAAEDTAGNTPMDIDSTPDTTPGNDAGGAPDTATDDSVGGDGTGVPGDIDPATDEDDQDPETVVVVDAPVFDLALAKTTTATTVAPGADVTYTLEVINQGTADANNIALVDYIPAGWTLSAADPLWTAAGATATYVLPGTLAAGTSTTVDIILTAGTTPGTVVNYAEITAADDATTGAPGMDVDSTPDATNGNDAGGNPDTATDDSVGGDGSGVPNGINPAADEDDHDPESVVVEEELQQLQFLQVLM